MITDNDINLIIKLRGGDRISWDVISDHMSLPKSTLRKSVRQAINKRGVHGASSIRFMASLQQKAFLEK